MCTNAHALFVGVLTTPIFRTLTASWQRRKIKLSREKAENSWLLSDFSFLFSAEFLVGSSATSSNIWLVTEDVVYPAVCRRYRTSGNLSGKESTRTWKLLSRVSLVSFRKEVKDRHYLSNSCSYKFTRRTELIDQLVLWHDVIYHVTIRWFADFSRDRAS